MKLYFLHQIFHFVDITFDIKFISDSDREPDEKAR